MRLVSRLIAGLLALVLVLVAVAYLLPRQVTVTREIVVAAPPAQVFPHIESLQKTEEWSPWTGLDPSVEITYAGPNRGVGNRMTWSSDDPTVGNGSQEIMVSIPDERIETTLDFGGLGMATAWQLLEPEGDGTRVTWGLQADTGSSPLGRYMDLMMDRWVGSDFETGLANLKALVEAG